MINSNSIDMIKLIAGALGGLNEKAVYVGGATLPFYIPALYWFQVRPTEDVDVVIEVIGRTNNWIMDNSLRQKGFRNDLSEGAPLCRWIYNGCKADIMTTDESVLGFTNLWYKEVVKNAIKVDLGGIIVQIFSYSYFLATKIEAFKNRGQQDYLGSKDMEDIISILEVGDQQTILTSIENSSKALKQYLKTELNKFSESSRFKESLPANAVNRTDPQKSAENILGNINLILNEIAKHE